VASITREANGRRTIQFMAADGKRKSLRLGKVNQHATEAVKTKVEVLVANMATGVAIDGETAKWLSTIGDELHGRLAAAGLVAPRQNVNARLADFIDRYIAGRTDAKRGTLCNLKMFGDRLTAFFGKDRDMSTIKRSDADAWVIWLKGNYAPGTWGRTIKGARQLFSAAGRAEITNRNPFEGIKAGSYTDKDRQHFITQEDTRIVIAACPEAQWRLIVALSRFGGLRCPSEHLALTWPDVDWERDRFRVNSSKTGERWVPIFPELRPYLQEAFEQAPEGTTQVITIKTDGNQNLWTRFAKIIRRAGLTPWPKLFHNLRASRETELAATYPLHVVCTWLGNSTLIAKKHYLQVTDADFQRAAKCGAVAVQNAVQQAAALSCTDSQESPQEKEDCEVSHDDASRCDDMRNPKVRLEGFEPPTYGSEDRCSIQLSYRRKC